MGQRDQATTDYHAKYFAHELTRRCPSNLRKQWYQELTEKFFLPCEILETKSYNAAVRQGKFRPFETERISTAIRPSATSSM